jgi:chromosome segregation ATPase
MEPRERLANIQERITSATASVQKIKGRHESATKSLESVQQECRDNKIDPDKIDEVITSLEQRFTFDAEKLEQDIDKAEQELAPFRGETQ